MAKDGQMADTIALLFRCDTFKEEEKDLRRTALDIAKWPIQFLSIFRVILGRRKILSFKAKPALELCIFPCKLF